MTRGLPWSVLFHAVLLTLAVMFGNTVQRRVIEPPMLIRARIVPTTALAPTEAPPQDAPAVEVAPRPEPQPELPPKEVPKSTPREKVEPIKRDDAPKPRPTETKEPAQASSQQPAQQAQLAPVGASVGGTDSNFEFAWYLGTIESQIARGWRPFKPGSPISCEVHFVVARNGAISQVTLRRASGVSVYDREALRAVQSTRLPPLPPQYGASSLGVTFIFRLEPGM